MGATVAGGTVSLSDRASSSRRNSGVMTACTETASRDESSAHHLFTTSTSPMPEWPYARDETWVFEPSGRGTNLRSNVLQRGSSAPSRLFHECLADFHSELEVPFQDGDDDLLAWVDSNLAPIDPHEMETEVPAAAAATTSSCSQQFLVAQEGFNRRISSISTSTRTSIQGGGSGAVFGTQENIIGPSFDNRMASMIDASENLYHGTGANSSTASTSAYSPAAAADHQSFYELRPRGSGLWNSSAAPGMTFEGLPGPVEAPSGMTFGGLLGSGSNVEPAPGWLQGSNGINVAADAASAPAGLIRHSSLPVAGGSRAIRGTATHPRSVAERLRRGKISERMKRLQDLVPNTDSRQSNTADMLDDVVEYVKQLQQKVEELSQMVVRLKLESAMHPD